MSQESFLKELFSRNYLYINDELQERLGKLHVTFLGCGLNSLAVEQAARLGIMQMTVIDFDTIEISNLNRQSFLITEEKKLKVAALQKRVHQINPYCRINAYAERITPINFADYTESSTILINTVDFDDGNYLLLNSMSQKKYELTIFPLNLGIAAAVFCFTKDSMPLEELIANKAAPQLSLVNFIMAAISKKIQFANTTRYFNSLLETYMQQKKIYDPQLIIGSSLTAAIIHSIILNFASGNELKLLPEFYFQSTKD